MMLRVGLTGGIASGKSTVARMFAKLGCFVIDADQIVSSLYQRDKSGHRAIVSRYGSEVLDSSGEIDRVKLSSVALKDEGNARELNALIHPLVIAETKRILTDSEAADGGRDGIAVVEASLILESGSRMIYDKIVVVDLDPSRQIERAVGRGMKREETERRMARQTRRDLRLGVADYVILNEESQADTEVQVFEVHKRLLQDLAALHRAGRVPPA